jgi:hypothetical protein
MGNSNISRTDPTPMGDLCRAIEDKDLEAARLALSQDPELVNNLNSLSDTEQQCSPIALAVFYNAPAIVALLLESGESVDHLAECGCTPLMSGCNEYFPGINRPWDSDREECMSLLLKHGAQVNTNCSSSGFGPLVAASSNGNTTCMQMLLDAGADANFASTNGFQIRPIHGAVKFGEIDAVRILLQAGADPNAIGKNPEDATQSFDAYSCCKKYEHSALGRWMDHVKGFSSPLLWELEFIARDSKNFTPQWTWLHDPHVLINLLKDVPSSVFLTSMNQPLFIAGRHESWSKECVALVSAATTLWLPTRAHLLSRPENFVVGANHLLMISTRLSIPMAVLHHVLSFCPRTWFDVASKKRHHGTPEALSNASLPDQQQFKRQKQKHIF